MKTVKFLSISLVVFVSLTALVYAQSSGFSDVPSGHWAANSIRWANTNGIMTGPGNQSGMFDPGGLVNRAQLATVAERQYSLQHAEVVTLMESIEDLETRVAALESSANALYYMAELSGANEVPSVNTDAWGIATMSLTGNSLQYDISIHDLSSTLTGAHFHLADFGVNGSAQYEIEFNGNSASGTWGNMTSTQIDALKSGNIYVNVHTTNHPDGEIRGQVEAQ